MYHMVGGENSLKMSAAELVNESQGCMHKSPEYTGSVNNDSLNYKDDCRTAPATLDLLKKSKQ